jgi:hypothetical protein
MTTSVDTNIGAHSSRFGYRLLKLDDYLYPSAFCLTVISV